MAKVIGWDFFRLNCKRSQGDICRCLLEDIIESGGLDSSEGVPDKDIECSIKNCGLWECMKDAEATP